MKKIYFNGLAKGFLSILILLLSVNLNAQLIPADLMENCNQWKITYPTGEEDKTLCDEPGNEFFYVSDAQDAIVFYAPIRSDNGTTPNSDNIRSELREREEDGSVDIYWTTEGTHMLYVKQAITHLPINKDELVATQIHGNKDDGIDDAMVMRLEGSHLFLSFNGGDLRSDVTIKDDYTLGVVHEVIFLIVDGKHYCYYSEDGNLYDAYANGNADSYLVRDGDNDYVMDLSYDESYFKVGNYTQSNADAEGDDVDDPDNYGEVYVYDFYVRHGTSDIEPVAVTGVSMSPTSISFIEGETEQLTATVSPSDATSKSVSYTSSNTSVATVSSSGVVSAVGEGSATITVTTTDGGFTASTSVDVEAAPEGLTNLALNKSVTGTGTPDGDNVPANVVDGDTDTRWSVSGYSQTITVDLGAEYDITYTELVCYNDRAYQYTIEASTDGSSYSEIVDRSSNSTAGTVSSPITDYFTTTSARYVRMTVTGEANDASTWVSLLEFRVFGEEGTSTPIAVSGVSISPTSVSILEGETQQLTASVSPSNADDQSVSYSSSNSSVATVSTSGLITALAEGSATITVTTTDGGYTASSSITVTSNNVPVTGISVSPTSVTLYVDGTQQLTATISPSNATDQSVSYSSNNTAVATVSSSGLITALAVGSATITVTTDDGGYTATSSITVEEISGEITNLALNKSVTVSSEPEADNSGANAVDGSTDTRWSASGYSQSLEVDLGAIYSISSTELVCYNDRAYQFVIESSTDGSSYTEIVDRSSNTTAGTATSPITDNFTAVDAQYVRITVSGAASYTGTWVSLLEFRVFGVEGTTTEPIAVTGVSISPSSASLLAGDTQQLSASVSPSNADNTSVSYTSSNTSVATVSSSGLATAVSAGNATITVTTADGGYTASSSITVTEETGEVVNLALNQSVTVSDEQSTNPGSNLVDGDADSRWSAESYSQWAEVDLGDTYSISSTEVVCFKDRAYQYIIEVSTDGISYTEIVDRSSNTTAGTNDAPITDDFSSVNARYVRINVSGEANDASSWVSIEELRVYGNSVAVKSAEDIESIAQNTITKMSLYPNPANEFLNFEMQEFNSADRILIYSTTGQLVHSQVIEDLSGSVDISHLSSGMYIVRTNGMAPITKLFIKE